MEKKRGGFLTACRDREARKSIKARGGIPGGMGKRESGRDVCIPVGLRDAIKIMTVGGSKKQHAGRGKSVVGQMVNVEKRNVQANEELRKGNARAAKGVV